jgi:hypothetical protein
MYYLCEELAIDSAQAVVVLVTNTSVDVGTDNDAGEHTAKPIDVMDSKR